LHSELEAFEQYIVWYIALEVKAFAHRSRRGQMGVGLVKVKFHPRSLPRFAGERQSAGFALRG